MKKKIYIKFLAVLVVVGGVTAIIISCNKLELTPLDKTTTATFFNKKADFDGGIFAAYSSMQDFWQVNSATSYGGHNGWGSFWVTSMLASDDAEFNSSQNLIVKKDILKMIESIENNQPATETDKERVDAGI